MYTFDKYVNIVHVLYMYYLYMRMRNKNLSIT